MSKLSTEIGELLNTHSRENASDTPDFILAEYLMSCLEAFELAVCRRESFYGRPAPDAQAHHPDDCACGCSSVLDALGIPSGLDDEARVKARAKHDAGVARLRAKRKARPKLKLRGVPCPDCGGSGKVTEVGMIERRCRRCGGTGEIP